MVLAVVLLPRGVMSMPKRKPPANTPSLPPDPGSTQNQVKLATLQDYYELGRRASDTQPDGTAKSPEPFKGLAVEAGVQADTIRKALKFATTYTLGELEELLALRTPAGEPLSWYLVRVLLQVKDKAERSKIQTRAAEEGWSRPDLQMAVQAHQGGKKSPGGRRFDVPTSPHQVLKRLTELSQSWLRFYEDIGEDGGLAEKLRKARRQGEKTAGLNRSVREASDRLQALQRAASKLADRLADVVPQSKELKQGPEDPQSTRTDAGKA